MSSRDQKLQMIASSDSSPLWDSLALLERNCALSDRTNQSSNGLSVTEQPLLFPSDLMLHSPTRPVLSSGILNRDVRGLFVVWITDPAIFLFTSEKWISNPIKCRKLEPILKAAKS